jgi:hypothetical protein
VYHLLPKSHVGLCVEVKIKFSGSLCLLPLFLKIFVCGLLFAEKQLCAGGPQLKNRVYTPVR